jgi:cell division protein FtsI (penicillin-binding protein 3)
MRRAAGPPRAPGRRRRSSDDDRSRRPNPRLRLGVTMVVFVLAFGGVIVRLVEVQALGGDRYEAYGAGQRFRTIPLPAGRGSIFDRNGHDLALSIPQTTIVANPSLIEDPHGTATALASILGEDVNELAARLSGGGEFAYVARRVDDTVAAEVAAAMGIDDGAGEHRVPGIFFIEEPERFTPSGALARSLIGQVGVDNEGLSGLELQFDEVLTGTPGELVVEQAPSGRTIPAGETQLDPALRGDDLVLTIDRSLQHETERALAEQIAAQEAKGGIAIVSRPATGEVLAMANLVADPETGEIVPTGNNMALTTVFEPGSVNKMISIAAAIEEGLVTPETMITVPDSLPVADHVFTDHVDHPTEEWSIGRILTKSSNVGTILVAQMLEEERIDAYLRRFGFGEPSGLGFPNEAAGLLLAPDDWSGTSIGSIPIGQGIAVTAMQMLSAYNVIANDGAYVPPRLVLETVDAEGRRHPTRTGEPRQVVSAHTASQMRDMLVNVVAEGTGSRGGVTGYTVAGKTGTARKPQPTGGYRDTEGNYRYVATFTGFVPAERPELSIIVAIDEPSGEIYGGSVAGPVFADLAQYGLRLFKVAPPLLESWPGPDTAAAEAAEAGFLTGPDDAAGPPPATPVRALPATALAERGAAAPTGG